VETCGNCGKQKRTKNGRFPQAMQRGKWFRQQRQNTGTGAGCRVAGMPSCSGTLGQPAELLCKKRQKPTKNPCSLPKTAVENLWKKKKSRKFRKKVCRRA